eukprot:14675.XXX_303815_304289_1 [CDS] Oithona nana genome sequencing.
MLRVFRRLPSILTTKTQTQQCQCLHITATKYVNEDGDKLVHGGPSWFLGGPKHNQKFITVGEFKGETRVDIRVYFKAEDDTSGKLFPSKKGISFTLDEYEELKSVLSEVDAEIKQ